MADQDGDKSQEATPHRRQQAREKGQVAKSQDLASAVLLLVGVLSLSWLGTPLCDFFAALAEQQLSHGVSVELGRDDFLARTLLLSGELARAVLPIFVALLVSGVAVNLVQTGIMFVPERIAPDISHLDPIAGFQRIFSLAGFVRLGFGIVKLLIVAVVAGIYAYQERATILGLTALDTRQLAAYLPTVLLSITLKIAVALVILALLDYGFQWWKQEQDLRMTTQEVREEMKDLQGDPQIIARRRMVQRQLVMNRLSKAVPKADVVVTNPTELAVAIQYDTQTMEAPIVVAKGAGALAQRIRRLALESGIPIIEKKPLAQALYKEVDLNRPIPQRLYAAVAELLAYVYQLKGKKPLPRG